jgi:hypothetical protein
MRLNKRLRIHIWIFSLKLILFHEFPDVIDTQFCLMFLICEDWMSYYKKNGSENIFMEFYMIMDFFFCILYRSKGKYIKILTLCQFDQWLLMPLQSNTKAQITILLLPHMVFQWCPCWYSTYLVLPFEYIIWNTCYFFSS